MNRIEQTFKSLKEQNKKALITFVTGGDPTMEDSEKHILTMAQNGADLIEIGIPFSDPVSEGPVIQAANERALQSGANLSKIMAMVKRLREKISTPIVFLMYFNTVLQYGIEKFCVDCVKNGIDGVIIPDLPYEESNEILVEADKVDFILITLVTPTSIERLKTITKNARGFLYCVSSLGVTGVRGNFQTNFGEFVGALQKVSQLPKAVGFGISTPEQVSVLKEHFDGVIIGSAIVRLIHQGENLAQYTSSIRKALGQ